MPKFTANKSTSQDFFDELNSYMQDNVLGSNGEIVDENFRKHKEESKKELDIQLPHVGSCYDMKRNGKPFRISIFGIEPGDCGNWDMKIKRKTTEDFNEKLYKEFNPHMKGTLHTLQLLFGLPVDDDSREIEIDGGRKCKIFDACCLSNALLYRERRKDSKQSEWPIAKKIWTNCERHIKKTIEIIQPQIIILQGDPTAALFNSVFEDQIEKRGEVYNYKINNKPMLVLWLYHHSYFARSHWSWDKIKDDYNFNISKLLEKYEEIWG